MIHFCVYTMDPEFSNVLDWLIEHGIDYEVHLNRTRFHVPMGTTMTHFLLKFAHCCPQIDDASDPSLNN